MEKKFLILIIFGIVNYNTFYSQEKNHLLSINSGKIVYDGIDEIIGTLKYIGNDYAFGIKYNKEKEDKELSINLLLSLKIERKPSSIVIPEYINIISYDDNNNYSIETNEELRLQKSHIGFFSLSYTKNILDKNKRSRFNVGASLYSYFVLTENLGNPELFIMSLEPNFSFFHYINKNIGIKINSSGGLLSLNVRRTYSGIDGYTSNDINGFKYLCDRSQFNLFSQYYHFNIQATIELKIIGPLYSSFSYWVDYFHIKKPRRYKAAADYYLIGLSYLF